MKHYSVRVECVRFYVIRRFEFDVGPMYGLESASVHRSRFGGCQFFSMKALVNKKAPGTDSIPAKASKLVFHHRPNLLVGAAGARCYVNCGRSSPSGGAKPLTSKGQCSSKCLVPEMPLIPQYGKAF